jgi:hypothetical protein
MMFLSQILLGSVLRNLFRDKLSADDYVSLIASGWILPLSLASLLWLLWQTLRPSEFSGLVLLFTMAIFAVALLIRARKEWVPGSRVIVLILLTLFGAFLFLRLALLSQVVLPLYFDSAQHYLIVKNIIGSFTSNEATSVLRPANAYYHVGFHLLTAFTASTLRADMIESILTLGQMIVASIPLAVFPVIKQETQSNTAGLLAVLLAAFGWYMPAYAVNWGKYPALASLPLITFVASLAYLSLQHQGVLSRRTHLGLTAILFSVVLITGMVHSRSLVILGIIVFAWSIATGWQRLSKLLRVVTFLVVLAGIGLMIMYIRTQDIFELLFDPYWEKGLLITIAILLLAVFGSWAYPRLTFASVLVIFMLLGSLLIPIRVLGYGRLTLLDRPFVEMILYLPLSVLGGAGLAGSEKAVQPLTVRWRLRGFSLAQTLGGLLMALLFLYMVIHYNFYTANCCSIVGRDDLVAIDWIDKNLPPDAEIAISSTELNVIVSDSPQGAAGGDAGIWITPLTDRTTLLVPYQSDFSQQATVNTLCKRGAGYLYVGEIGTTFNKGLITAYPNWYRILLSMPKAKIYQLTGCPENSP